MNKNASRLLEALKSDKADREARQPKMISTQSPPGINWTDDQFLAVGASAGLSEDETYDAWADLQAEGKLGGDCFAVKLV